MAAGLSLAAGLFSVETLAVSASMRNTFLNVSYDSTKMLYKGINHFFTKNFPHYQERFLISNGGSHSQALSVMNGEPADIVTLGDVSDIDALVRNGLIAKNWRSDFPHQSTPFLSTIVFLVRKGNPKNIQDWGDLTDPTIQIMTPNPKTSSGAKWNYLAAWGWAQREWLGNTEKARQYMKNVFSHVPIFDTSARSSTTSFVRRGIGDVLLAWETDALLCARETGINDFDIVVPSTSILAQPPVAVVHKNVEKRRTSALAHDYLNFLFSDTGQKIGMKHFFRPSEPKLKDQLPSYFPDIAFFTLSSLGAIADLNRQHFATGALFDQIQQEKREKRA